MPAPKLKTYIIKEFSNVVDTYAVEANSIEQAEERFYNGEKRDVELNHEIECNETEITECEHLEVGEDICLDCHKRMIRLPMSKAMKHKLWPKAYAQAVKTINKHARQGGSVGAHDVEREALTILENIINKQYMPMENLKSPEEFVKEWRILKK